MKEIKFDRIKNEDKIEIVNHLTTYLKGYLKEAVESDENFDLKTELRIAMNFLKLDIIDFYSKRIKIEEK